MQGKFWQNLKSQHVTQKVGMYLDHSGTSEKTQTTQETFPQKDNEPQTVDPALDAEPAGREEKTRKRRFAAKFCPRCGSTDVFWAQGMPQLWSLWQCRNCHYRGPLILEDGNMAEKLQEEWDKKKHEE